MSSAPSILPRDLLFLLQKDGVKPFLLDVRDPHEFNFVAIEGAVNVPLKDLPDHLGALPTDCKIVTICHHGMRSMRAAELLLQNGFGDVVSMTGGMNVWAIDVDPRLPKY